MPPLRFFWALWAMLLGLTVSAHAAPIITGPPDVLVIVYQQPGGADQVDITYARTVPRAQAVKDMEALTQASGWPISPAGIKDAEAPMQSKVGPMTSIVFQAPGVVQDSAHTFPVETFARAFSAYKRLNLIFFVGPQFVFQGSRTYADNDIKIALDQHGTTYVYQVEIANPDFGRLPLAPPPPAAPTRPGHGSPWRIVLGILGVSALAGVAVYFLTARLTPPPGPGPKPESSNSDAETRLEANTRG